MSWPVTGEVETRVLTALASAGTSSTPELTERLGLSTSTVHATLVRLVQAGLVHAVDGQVSLTPRGRLRARELRHFPDGPPPNSATVDFGDLAEVARSIRALWPSAGEQSAAEARRRDELLAADADRDLAVHQLADALAQGRLSAAEFDERTSRALTARTYGDLDDCLRGLGAVGTSTRPVESHPVRKVVFGIVAFVSSPFVLIGSVMVAFGGDVSAIVVGLVLLVLTLPGLFGLWRWAWPRR